MNKFSSNKFFKYIFELFNFVWMGEGNGCQNMTKTCIGKLEVSVCLHLVDKSLKGLEIKMGAIVYL